VFHVLVGVQGIAVQNPPHVEGVCQEYVFAPVIVGTCQTVVEPAIITGIHSTATTHALTLVILVSVACQSSIEPTHNAVLVLAVIHATGNHVQFVNVQDVGVQSTSHI